MMNSLIILLFIAGYCAIVLERSTKISKSGIALFTGVACWTVYIAIAPGKVLVAQQLIKHVGEFSQILFFMMGAMAIVEIIDLHRGFEIITGLIAVRNKRTLLWIVAFTSFFLSAVLDNLTTTIVMISLLTKLVTDTRERLLFISMIVIAANAGGAWSPIGDITTTMLWIGGRITSWKMISALFLPSFVSLAVPLLFSSFFLRNRFAVLPAANRESALTDPMIEKYAALGAGFGVLIFVPLFKALTHLPPFMGMMIGVAILSIIMECMHYKKTSEPRAAHSIADALQRIDLQTIFFFLGILLCIASLDATGILAGFAGRLNHHLGKPHLIVFVMGLFSAVVDNVPLVAAAMGMYDLSQFGTDHGFWLFLSYCVGTGGSLLIIGSAAGVAAMGMAKIDFFWYVKRITPLALSGYVAGAATCLLIEALSK